MYIEIELTDSTGTKNEDKEFLDEYAIRLEVKSNQERNISYQMVYNKLVPGQHMSINDAWSAFKTLRTMRVVRIDLC